MAVPEGYTALGRLGYADKGNYAAGTTYMTGDVVYHNGSSYVARKDNLKGVTPVDGNDWKYLARGFAAETMADVQATDTSGVLGTAGAQVVSQSLIDAIADRVMTKLIGTNQIVNNLLATEPGSVLDATQGKALKEYYDRVSSDLGEKYGPVRQLTAADDLNNITTNGTYWYLTESVPANAPYNNAAIVEVSGSTSDTTQKIQRATRYGVPGQSAFRPLISSTGWLDWAYNLTNADIQSGTTTVNATANGITEFTVNFPETFAKPPVVIMSVVTSRPDLRSVEPLSRDTQKVTGAVYNGTSAAVVSVFWIAVAK